MGNHLSNFCSGTCTCIFPESEELKETHIIQLAEKYPDFPKDILEDIDNHINILYHNKDELEASNTIGIQWLYISKNPDTLKRDTLIYQL